MPVRRRRFLAASSALLAAPLASFAQPRQEVRRVAYLGSTTLNSGRHLVRAFFKEMTTLGWTEGRNLQVDSRWADGDPKSYDSLVAGLLASNPDLFIASVDAIARQAATRTKTIPIVFVLGFDPVGLGVVKSLASPGGNVTGFSVLNYELLPKRLSLLKEMVPRLARVAVIYREGGAQAQKWVKLLTDEAGKLGIRILPGAMRDSDDIVPVFTDLARQKADGVLNVPEPFFFQHRKLMAELALQHRMASLFGATEFADAGALMAYASNFAAVYRQAAKLADKILRGAAPSSIPVEQSNVYELIINLRTAKALGIAVPRAILLQATRVIE